MIVREYDHNNNNVIEACGLSDDVNEYIHGMDSFTDLLLKAHPRILALYLVNMVPNVNKPLHYMSSTTKFTKMPVPKVNKPVHPKFKAIVQDNIDDLPNMMNKNMLLFEHAAWHHHLLYIAMLFFPKKSKVVEFVEMNYTKEEIMLMCAAIQRGKAEVETQEMVEKLTSDLDSTLKELMKDTLNKIASHSVKYEGKTYTDEQLGIHFHDDPIDREIDQNMPSEDLTKGCRIQQIFGVSSDIADNLIGLSFQEGVDHIFTSNYTMAEKAVIADLVIANKMRSLEKDADIHEHYIIYKLWLEMMFNKSDWRHQLVLHDRISRIQWFIDNNGTKEDLIYILDSVL